MQDKAKTIIDALRKHFDYAICAFLYPEGVVFLFGVPGYEKKVLVEDWCFTVKNPYDIVNMLWEDIIYEDFLRRCRV